MSTTEIEKAEAALRSTIEYHAHLLARAERNPTLENIRAYTGHAKWVARDEHALKQAKGE